jgi:hypothetical protein
VAQLAFSGDGRALITIGIEYTVAVYNSDTTSEKNTALGKMVASSQGPKGSVFHVSSFGASSKTSPEYKFLSVGEKHYSVWTLAGSTLTSENGKLGSLKNKNMLSAAKGPV